MLLLSFFLRFEKQYVLAPELVRGELVSAHIAGYRIGYVDGGDVRFLVAGRRNGDVEVGIFLRLFGGQIDNDNMPVPYHVTHRNTHKFIGWIEYRGHPRKFCAANDISNLPCQ